MFVLRLPLKHSFFICFLLVCFLLTGCVSPIRIQQRPLITAYRERNQSALNGQYISATSRLVLERQNLLKLWHKNPAAALTALWHSTQMGFFTPNLLDQLFTLAETNYALARRQNDRSRFMLAALYAYAYLNPDAPLEDRPSPYDPHFRQACDLYMLALTEAMGDPVISTNQHWTLPIGTFDLSAPATKPLWHGYLLTDLRPTARLSVIGIKNIYRTPGLGEPLAATPIPLVTPLSSTQLSSPTTVPKQNTFIPTVTRKIRVPVNLIIRIPHVRQQILSDHITGQMILTPLDTSTLQPQKTFPLQYDQTTARAMSLYQNVHWSKEYKGYLNGKIFDTPHTTQLVIVEPHKVGRIPVVFIHGTASSSARWATMLNNLLEDPLITAHFEFWFFSYATGNPIPYSALQLRRSLNKVLHALGGPQIDPALGKIVLIGHSQGGLLAKMLVIDAHDQLWNSLSKRPLSQLHHLTPTARAILQESLFPQAMPEIRTVIFIATPHNGSYLAASPIAHLIGRMVTFPLDITNTLNQLVQGNHAFMRSGINPHHLGSVYDMSPNSAFIHALATIPIAPYIRAYSIIPIRGDYLSNKDKENDGVVFYKSAHIKEVVSELVVPRSTHSTQTTPITIAEVHRILLQQLPSSIVSLSQHNISYKTYIIHMGGDYRIPVKLTAHPAHP